MTLRCPCLKIEACSLLLQLSSSLLLLKKKREKGDKKNIKKVGGIHKASKEKEMGGGRALFPWTY